MKTSESISSLATALCKFQGDVKQPKKDANNPYFNSKYVPLEGVVSAISVPLKTHGLSYFQSVSTIDEQVIVKTLVMHESGEFIESDELKIPGYQVRKDGTKDFNPQGIGASITYGRRYSLTAALGIASEDDDDGNTGSQGSKEPMQQNKKSQQNSSEPLATEAQATMLYKKMNASGIGLQRVSDYLGYEVKNTKDIHRNDVNKLIKFFEENTILT